MNPYQTCEKPASKSVIITSILGGYLSAASTGVCALKSVLTNFWTFRCTALNVPIRTSCLSLINPSGVGRERFFTAVLKKPAVYVYMDRICDVYAESCCCCFVRVLPYLFLARRSVRGSSRRTARVITMQSGCAEGFPLPPTYTAALPAAPPPMPAPRRFYRPVCLCLVMTRPWNGNGEAVVGCGEATTNNRSRS